MGLPIVTTDLPGCKEVVDHGVNGFLVPGRDGRSLARALKRLAHDPELRRRMGRESRRRALTEFDLSIIVDEFSNIYWTLLDAKGLLPARPGGVARKPVVATAPRNGNLRD